MDLKHLLAEAKQKIPPFLAALEPENEELLNVGGKIIFEDIESLWVRYPVYMGQTIDQFYILVFLDERGCAYCGGLGHRITDCPKLEAKQIKETGNIGRKDYLAHGAADW